MIDPNLCPTHKLEMDDGANKLEVPHKICPECKFELYQRITKLKEKALALKLIWDRAKHPNLVQPFEGL